MLLMGESTISMAIFNSYVCLPEGMFCLPEAFGLWFHSVGDFIIPTDEVHHFSEG